MTPRTQAGRALLSWEGYDESVRAAILAIEAEARADRDAEVAALREALEEQRRAALASRTAVRASWRWLEQVEREERHAVTDARGWAFRRVLALIDAALAAEPVP